MLESLLYPHSVAVIGASKNPGKVGYELVANLVKGGFAGDLVLVNPTALEIMGHHCYPRLEDYEGTIELSVVATPVPGVAAAVRSSLDKGARAVVVITAGFKEVGKEGAALERSLEEMCSARGARLLGPNCLGVINTAHHLNASFAAQMPERGSISVVSQSGALCAALMDWLIGRRIGLAKMISIGNKADLDETDILQALSGDPETHVIAGYLESITSGEEFVRAAESVSAAKPVVMLKVGTTAAGSRAASSHTGSLAGADIAYGAAFKRCGVIRAETFEALLDYSLAFSMQPLPAGKRVAIITNAGGPGIMAADAVESSGLSIAVLSGSTATALRAKLPTAASVANPIDVLGDADPERYAEAVKAAQDDPNVDAILVLLTPQAMTRPAETARVVAAAARAEKPLLAVFMGGADVMPGREELAAASLPDYPSPERAVAALRAMCDYSAWRNRPPRRLTRFPVNRRRVMRVINSQWNMGRLRVSEPRAKEMLKAYDFLVPEGSVALSVDAAVETATRVGFPVAMKIVSPDIVHKSDVGGVRLGLNTADEVRDAFDLMMLRIPLRQPGARLEGVYVEAMAPRGREVIIGMTRDPQFGPMLMFGLGGIFVEIMKDVTFHLAPITAEEAMEMLRGTKSFALLEGARGQSGVDLDAIAIGLQHISQLVTDFPQIAELDINPFIVSELIAQPIVADARITLLPKETM